MRYAELLTEDERLVPFKTMTRDQFLGKPSITTATNARDLKPKVLSTLQDQPRVAFLNGRYTAVYGEDGAAVFDGDNPIASYNFGDTLVVSPKYRRQGIGAELVYQWRTRFPASPPAKQRTKVSHALQKKVWDRIQRELGRS